MAQFNKDTQTYVDGRRILHDVQMISNKNGDIVTADNRFPVDIANQTVNIDTSTPLDVNILGDVNVTQGTTPWTVDGTVSVDNFPATQTVDGTVSATVSGTVSVDNFPATQTVDGTVSATVSGTVSVDNFPDTQTVDGTVSVDNFPATQTVDGTVNIGNEVSINDGGNSITVDGTVGITGDVNVTQGTDPWTVDGTVNVSNTVSVNDGGGSITVDGTVGVTGPGIFPEDVLDYDPYGQRVIRIDDTSKQHTSKNRVKVSTYDVTDFATFTTGKDLDIWDEIVTGTSSSSVHDEYLGMVKMTVGPNVGDKVYRQTKRVQRYIPGRQGEVSMTMIFGQPTTGIRRRFGMFDDLNGFFFEDSGDGTYRCVLRRNTAGGVVEESFTRDEWNVDKLDGTGTAGITANPLAIQHLSIEYEWYGAGMIEWNFIINNNKYPIHRIFHANNHDHTWAAKAALPVRVEIENIGGTAGTHTFYQGSHSFATEGSTEILGRQISISTDIEGKGLQNSNVFYPMVAIRLKSTALDSVVIPDEYSAATLDNTSIFIRAIELPQIIGGTWVSMGPDSAVEYNITATSYTGGNVLSTTYVSSNNQGSIFTFPRHTLTQLLRNTTTTLGDTSGVFLIAVASVNSNKDGFASLGWVEVR